MSRPKRGGFTLMELLVILAIIAIIVGLLLPSTRRVREASDRAKCQNNMKQVALAFHNYDSQFGHLPAGCRGVETTPESRLSWMFELLPFLELDSIYKEVALQGYAIDLPELQARIGLYLCPTSLKEAPPPDGITHYIAMAGVGRDAASSPKRTANSGIMGYDRHTTLAMIAAADGTANTIALMETRSELGSWARGGPSTLRGFDPTDLPLFGNDRPFAGHTSGWQVAMVDGAIRFVPASVDPKKLAPWITFSGGEPLEPLGGD
jgi:hypothetical protein